MEKEGLERVKRKDETWVEGAQREKEGRPRYGSNREKEKRMEVTQREKRDMEVIKR